MNTQSRGAQCRAGNVVSDSVITVRGARRGPAVWGPLHKLCERLTTMPYA